MTEYTEQELTPYRMLSRAIYKHTTRDLLGIGIGISSDPTYSLYAPNQNQNAIIDKIYTITPKHYIKYYAESTYLVLNIPDNEMKTYAGLLLLISI